jgi:hypothetical protein
MMLQTLDAGGSCRQMGAVDDISRYSVLGLALVTCFAVKASAQSFDVKGLHVEKGAIEIASDNAIFSGGLNKSAHEQVVHYGLRSWWRLSGAVEWENPVGQDVRASHVALESIFVLRPLKQANDVGLGFFSSIEGSVHRSSTNAFVFGPIIAAKLDKLTVTLNPFLEQTFGRNREEGIALAYAWQAKYEILGGVSVGVEGYGLVENLVDTPRLGDQVHRIGPVLFREFELSNGVKIEPSIGVLFGLTPATPDLTFRANIDFHFH